VPQQQKNMHNNTKLRHNVYSFYLFQQKLLNLLFSVVKTIYFLLLLVWYSAKNEKDYCNQRGLL